MPTRRNAVSALYTPHMLALSAQLSLYPWSDGFAYQSDGRSSVCGSTMTMGLNLDASEAVKDVGLKITACAVGQSSAAIFASAARGANAAMIAATLEGLNRWLDGEGDLPEWPQLDVIVGVRGHPGRYGALLLPWKTALAALPPAT